LGLQTPLNAARHEKLRPDDTLPVSKPLGQQGVGLKTARRPTIKTQNHLYVRSGMLLLMPQRYINASLSMAECTPHCCWLQRMSQSNLARSTVTT